MEVEHPTTAASVDTEEDDSKEVEAEDDEDDDDDDDKDVESDAEEDDTVEADAAEAPDASDATRTKQPKKAGSLGTLRARVSLCARLLLSGWLTYAPRCSQGDGPAAADRSREAHRQGRPRRQAHQLGRHVPDRQVGRTCDTKALWDPQRSPSLTT